MSQEETLPVDPRIESLHEFLSQHYQTPLEEREATYNRWDLTLSDVNIADIEAIVRREPFEVTGLNTFPRANGKPEDEDKVRYCFYVGNTEFTINGKLADEFEGFHQNRMKNKKKD